MANKKKKVNSNNKTVRQDKKRNQRNKSYQTSLKNLVKNMRTTKTSEELKKIYKKTDSMVAKGKISKNKANRIKSKMAKLTNKK